MWSGLEVEFSALKILRGGFLIPVDVSFKTGNLAGIPTVYDLELGQLY